ncbi:MAG: pirin family protein [Melioribacteraceae bacterium]|nr:pirin family protein [Melioribacteraceae bacterium]
MSKNNILDISPLGFPWKTQDPFLFCAYHKDAYPKGNENMGPDTSLQGRNLGQDFTIKDGWRMYHGEIIPGFPSHPHRGFETITIAESGIVDHADSLGGLGRFGKGDVQWMTAGKGIQHSEMFPLLNIDEENPFEIFQIWLNLSQANKLVEPYFTMLWNETIPFLDVVDENKKSIHIRIISGELGNIKYNYPAPDSWAANSENNVTICTIRMEAGAKWMLPKTSSEVNRTLYFYSGSTMNFDEETVSVNHSIVVKVDEEITLVCGDEDGFILLLQGKPINEPVAQYGPFVMNTKLELQQTMEEYQKTQFGGWPWPRHDQVHERTKGRFALYPNGQLDLK